jgi:hypothetical protein
VSHRFAPPPSEPHSDDLGVERQSLPRWWWIPAVAVCLLLLLWWMKHPSDLRAGHDVSGPTRVNQEVYVGIDAPAGRTLHVRSVTVHWHGKPSGASWDAYVCKGGALGFTPDPDPFCRSLQPAEGATLDTDTDQLVITVAANRAGTLTVDDIQVSFREGIQWGTRSIGPKVTVTVAE